MFKTTKCMTCKKDVTLAKEPWDTCPCYPSGIPVEVFKVLANDDTQTHEKCKEYEFNPEWDD